MRWFKKKEVPAPTAVVETLTRPMLVNPGSDERLTQANYRLHAIVRYIEQTEVISPAKMDEFRSEAAQHGFNLVQRGALSQNYVDELLKKVG